MPSPPITLTIRHRTTGAPLFAHAAPDNDWERTLREAARQRADLAGADLSRRGLDLAPHADLPAHLALDGLRAPGALFHGLTLSTANMQHASLAGADFRHTNLVDVYFTGSDLRGALFENARLTYANFARADLTGAQLAGASLGGVYFEDANVAAADWSLVREDFTTTLQNFSYPHAWQRLAAQLETGQLNHSLLAALDLPPDESSLAELFFHGIGPGATPATHPLAALAQGWLREFLGESGG